MAINKQGEGAASTTKQCKDDITSYPRLREHGCFCSQRTDSRERHSLESLQSKQNIRQKIYLFTCKRVSNALRVHRIARG